MACTFKELAIDGYIKYQSTLNSSWFIGFDESGSAISGRVSIKRDGSMLSMTRERCYQFAKFNTLTTTTQFFPEASKLNPINSASTNITNTNYYTNIRASTSHLANAAVLAQLNGPVVYSYHQNQLIDMTRYRNILRYQLGIRSLNQPLVAIDNTDINSKTNITTLENHHHETYH